MKPANIHATALVVGESGLLITGPSGSGKSALALALLDREQHARRYGRLISDDQTLVAAVDGRLVARVAPSIAGMAEVRGYGLRHLPFEQAAIIDIVLAMTGPGQIQRLPETETTEIAGITLPMLRLPAKQSTEAIRILDAWLSRPVLSTD